jgi:RNA polymerase sigma factor (sigma-70 family)
MEDAAKVDILINFARTKLMKRYRRRMGKLGLDELERTVLAASAATMGLARALKTLSKWDPERGEFPHFVYLRARKVLAKDLDQVEKNLENQAHSLDEDERDEIEAPRCALTGMLFSNELKAVLEAIKPEHAQILNLRSYGYSVDEIAHHLDRSEASTKSLLRRAREAAARAHAQRDEPPERRHDGSPASAPPDNIIHIEAHRNQRGQNRDKTK